MPTNSDLKRWYKVYNVEQKDFVRYDAMFRVFCYDAVDDFHAVNLGQMNEAIKRAIQGHEYDINIENGLGGGSLQQKYVKNDVDYSAQATGENATAFGGKRYDKLDDLNRTATSAEGDQSFAVGGSVHAIGDFSIALGKDTDAYQRASLVSGGGTKAGFTESEFNAYYWDSANNKALHNGQGKDENGNILDCDGKTYSKSYSFAVALGEINYVYGRAAFSSGFGNRVYGANAGTFGKANRVNAGGGITGGYNNIVDSLNSLVVGGDNQAKGTCSNLSGLGNIVENGTSVLVSGNDNSLLGSVSNSAAIGQKNTIKSNQSFAANYSNYIGSNSLDSAVFGAENTIQDSNPNAFVAGKGNKTANRNQSIFGTYNDPNGSALFQIGRGDSDTNRKNAFEVLKDGRAKVQTKPEEPNDVVRKLELESSWNDFNLENGTKNGSLQNKGSGSEATGANSLAIGNTCKATNSGTSSFGQNSIASGTNSLAEGYASTSAGADSHAEGNNTTSSGWGTHSEGIFTQAIGKASHAGGYYTIAQEDYQQVIGKYNANSSNALFIVGNGTSTNNRKNAFEVLIDGRAKVKAAPIQDDDVVRKADLANVGGGKLYLHSLALSNFVDSSSSPTETAERAMVRIYSSKSTPFDMSSPAALQNEIFHRTPPYEPFPATYYYEYLEAGVSNKSATFVLNSGIVAFIFVDNKRYENVGDLGTDTVTEL